MPTDDLLTSLFEGQPHLLYQPMARWLASSRRFTTFVTTFQDKIRKKLRARQDQESLLDLQLELETAYLLLQERSLNVVYEPEISRGIRSPDFAVSFTTSLTFMLEVTRVQADSKHTRDVRLAHTISAKLGQLLPQLSNVLLIGVEAMDLIPSDMRAAMVSLQQRVEQGDSLFLQRHGFQDRSDYFRHYQRLSVILVRGPQVEGTKSILTWNNPQAKYPLPSKVRTALCRCHTS